MVLRPRLDAGAHYFSKSEVGLVHRYLFLPEKWADKCCAPVFGSRILPFYSEYVRSLEQGDGEYPPEVLAADLGLRPRRDAAGRPCLGDDD
jgi:hypothetical protein